MNFIQMFKEIEHYHSGLGQQRKYSCPEEQMQCVRDVILATYQELAELTDSLPWKPWRQTVDQTNDLDNAAREIIDIIFFLGAIAEHLQITPKQLEDKFWAVLNNNYKRLEDGYSKKMEGGDTGG